MTDAKKLCFLKDQEEVLKFEEQKKVQKIQVSAGYMTKIPIIFHKKQVQTYHANELRIPHTSTRDYITFVVNEILAIGS